MKVAAKPGTGRGLVSELNVALVGGFYDYDTPGSAVLYLVCVSDYVCVCDYLCSSIDGSFGYISIM